MFDLIIIGGSATGCSAAIYAARRKLNFKLIADDLGGEVALSGEVNNWPGIISIQGFELSQKFAAHVKSYGVDIEEGWRVESIAPKKNYQIVKAKNAAGESRVYEAKAVIIGTGIHPKRLNIPGERELDRKGVTSCTVCDGPLFRGKTTATIGSGNSALESVLMMGELAKKVYLLSKYPDTNETQGGFPKGDKILIDKVKSLANVEIIYNAKTTEIIGSDRVSGLQFIDQAGKNKKISVEGVMVHIGMIPNSQLADVAKNKLGEIIIDDKCRTNIAGIFAGGDVTNVAYKQIGIAAGQGIVAALAAIEYINLWTNS